MKQCTFCQKGHDRIQETCSKSCSLKASNQQKFPKTTKTCVVCNSQFEVEFIRRDNLTCNRKCAKKLADRSIDKAAAGRKISETRLKRGSEGLITYPGNPWSEKTRTHLISLMKDGRRKGEKNGMHGRKHHNESKDAMSATKSRKIANGEYDRSKWARKGQIWAEKAQLLIPYRSSWEKRAIEMLESDSDVSSFKFESIRIPYYRIEGEKMNLRHYVPDFIVSRTDGSQLMIEVKPLCYVNSAINTAKAAAAREYCDSNGIEFQFWTQTELGL